MSSSIFKQFTDRIQTFNSIELEKDIKNTLVEEKLIKLKKDFNKLMEKITAWKFKTKDLLRNFGIYKMA